MAKMMTPRSLSGGSLVAIAMGLSKVVIALTAFLLAFMLGAEEYGVFAFMLSTAALIGGFGELALPSIVTREVSQNPSKARHLYRSSVLLVTASILLAATVLVTAATRIGPDFLPESAQPLKEIIPWVGIVCYALGLSLVSLTTATLLAKKRYPLWAIFTGGQTLVVGAASCLLALTYNPAYIMLGSGGAQLIFALIGMVLVNRMDKTEGNQPLRREAWRLFKIAYSPGIASQLITVANWIAVVILISQENGLVLVAWFSIASRLAAGLSFLPFSSITTKTPQLNEAVGTANFESIFRATFRKSLAWACGVALAIIVFAPFVQVLGEQYQDAESMIRLMALTIPLTAINQLLGTTALATHNHVLWALSDFLLAGAILLGAYVLIPSLPESGPAYNQILAYLVSVVFLALGLKRLQSAKSKRHCKNKQVSGDSQS